MILTMNKLDRQQIALYIPQDMNDKLNLIAKKRYSTRNAIILQIISKSEEFK